MISVKKNTARTDLTRKLIQAYQWYRLSNEYSHNIIYDEAAARYDVDKEAVRAVARKFRPMCEECEDDGNCMANECTSRLDVLMAVDGDEMLKRFRSRLARDRAIGEVAEAALTRLEQEGVDLRRFDFVRQKDVGASCVTVKLNETYPRKDVATAIGERHVTVVPKGTPGLEATVSRFREACEDLLDVADQLRWLAELAEEFANRMGTTRICPQLSGYFWPNTACCSLEPDNHASVAEIGLVSRNGTVDIKLSGVSPEVAKQVCRILTE